MTLTRTRLSQLLDLFDRALQPGERCGTGSSSLEQLHRIHVTHSLDATKIRDDHRDGPPHPGSTTHHQLMGRRVLLQPLDCSLDIAGIGFAELLEGDAFVHDARRGFDFTLFGDDEHAVDKRRRFVGILEVTDQ